jgi:hypothetical protein
LLNTSAFISSKFSYENYTEINYTDNNKFKICFNNMDKTVYKYNMQIKINIIFNNYFFKEDFLVYTLPIDLTAEFISKDFIIIISLIIIIIIIVLIFLFYNFKLRKRNKNLEKRILTFSLTSVNNTPLYNEYSEKKVDPDYDNTFI